MKELILNTIDDLCMNLFVYDRKDDEDLSTEQLLNAIRSGEVTVEEIVEQFRINVEDTVNDKQD